MTDEETTTTEVETRTTKVEETTGLVVDGDATPDKDPEDDDPDEG